MIISISQADVKQGGGDCSQLANDQEDGEDLQVFPFAIILPRVFFTKQSSHILCEL